MSDTNSGHQLRATPCAGNPTQCRSLSSALDLQAETLISALGLQELTPYARERLVAACHGLGEKRARAGHALDGLRHRYESERVCVCVCVFEVCVWGERGGGEGSLYVRMSLYLRARVFMCACGSKEGNKSNDAYFLKQKPSQK